MNLERFTCAPVVVGVGRSFGSGVFALGVAARLLSVSRPNLLLGPRHAARIPEDNRALKPAECSCEMLNYASFPHLHQTCKAFQQWKLLPSGAPAGT